MGVVETFVRENGPILRGTAAAIWLLAATGAIRLSFDRLGRSRRAWAVIAIATLGFAIETACHFRFESTDLGRNALRTLGGDVAYQHRRPLQAAVIAGCILPLMVFLAVRVVRSKTVSRPAMVGLLGVGIGSVGLVLETISLHQIDQIPFVYQSLRCLGLGLALWGVGTGSVRARSCRRPPAH